MGAREIEAELLFFADCPFYEKAQEILDVALKECGVAARVIKTEITNDEMAVAKKFLGSPTIRIDGVDVDPVARHGRTYTRMCRIYWIKDGFIGWPPREMLIEAIEKAK